MSCCPPAPPQNTGFKPSQYQASASAVKPARVVIPAGAGFIGTNTPIHLLDREGALRQQRVEVLSMSQQFSGQFSGQASLLPLYNFTSNKAITMRLIGSRQLISKLLLFTLIVVPVISVQPIAFADYIPPESVSVDIATTMEKALSFIAEGKLKKATKQLQKVVVQDKDNADAWNLLGYSWRKLEKYRKSRKAYARALKIDPDHRGALEYQGELFIETGKTDKAKANLAKLKALCPDGCEELDNLTQALAGNSSY